MVNHHPTVRDRYGSLQGRRVSGTAAAKRSTPSTTPMYGDQRRRESATASATTSLERQRMCADELQSFPFYSGRIALPPPYTLPRLYDAGSLVAGGCAFQQQQPTLTPPAAVRPNDVTTRSDATAAVSFPDAATPLTTYCRGSVNGATVNRCPDNRGGRPVTSPLTAVKRNDRRRPP